MIKFGTKEEVEQTIREKYAMSDAAWRLYGIKFWEFYEHTQSTEEAKRMAIEYLKSVHMIR